MTEGKICTKCKEFKPYESYPKCSDSRDGLQYRCRDCFRLTYMTKRKPHNPYIDGEVWMPVLGFEGYFAVSDIGRVKSLKREIIKKDGKIYTAQERILQYYKNKKGYLSVCLSLNGKNWSKLVHRLVASAFYSNENNYPEVNHKDGSKTNNIKSNLEWCTTLDNNKHARKMGLIKYVSGNNKQVKNNKTGEVFKSIAEASRTINMHAQSLSNRLHGKTKNETNFILL